jgi:Beta-galactosidase
MGFRVRREVLIAAVAGLVVAALAFAALAFVFRPAGSPAPSPGPTTSLVPSGSPGPQGPIGVYAFTAGQQNVSNPADVIAKLNAGSFHPNGIDWVIGWRLLEPSAGDFNWSILDNDLSAATAAGYRSFIEIIPGEDAPAWALAQCPTVQVTLQNSSQPTTICVPTSSQFLTMWMQLIAAVGHRYNGRVDLTMVQATGCGVQGEMQIPDHNAAFWAQYGLNSDTLLGAWEQVVSAWRAALPNTPSSLAIEEPLGNGNSNVLHPLLTYVQEHFGSSVWVQQNGLRQGTQTSAGSYGGDLAAASVWTKVGWQMFGAGSANGDLAAALTDGLAVRPSFYEVYLSDILNTASGTALNGVRAGA